MNLKSLLLALLCIGLFAACQKDVTPEEDVFTSLTLDAEGGHTEVYLGQGDWNILQIVPTDFSGNLFGDAFSLDGQLLRQNQPLALEGYGRLVFNGIHTGFELTYASPEELQINLSENASGKPFQFTVTLSNGERTQEVLVQQPISAGYTFGSIDYFIADRDGDSVYIEPNHKRYVTFELTSPREVLIYPFSGVDLTRSSHFESVDPYAFVWFEGADLEVRIPWSIYDGRVQYGNNRKGIYGEISKEQYGADVSVGIPMEEGVNSFEIQLEYRKRVVSYKMTMEHSTFGDSKEIVGKWIEVSPTGHYEIKRVAPRL